MLVDIVIDVTQKKIDCHIHWSVMIKLKTYFINIFCCCCHLNDDICHFYFWFENNPLFGISNVGGVWWVCKVLSTDCIFMFMTCHLCRCTIWLETFILSPPASTAFIMTSLVWTSLSHWQAWKASYCFWNPLFLQLGLLKLVFATEKFKRVWNGEKMGQTEKPEKIVQTAWN